MTSNLAAQNLVRCRSVSRSCWATSLLALLIVGLFGSTAFSQTDEKANDAFAEFLKNEASELPDESVKEILDIRQRLGGGTGLGISELFSEATIESSNETTKVSETGSYCLAAELAAFDLPSDRSLSPNPESACCPAERLFFEMLATATEPKVENADSEKSVYSIRNVVRKMESLAADLEDLELYSDADSIRNRAAKLRIQARRTAKSEQRGASSTIR